MTDVAASLCGTGLLILFYLAKRHALVRHKDTNHARDYDF